MTDRPQRKIGICLVPWRKSPGVHTATTVGRIPIRGWAVRLSPHCWWKSGKSRIRKTQNRRHVKRLSIWKSHSVKLSSRFALRSQQIDNPELSSFNSKSSISEQKSQHTNVWEESEMDIPYSNLRIHKSQCQSQIRSPRLTTAFSIVRSADSFSDNQNFQKGIEILGSDQVTSRSKNADKNQSIGTQIQSTVLKS